MSNEPYLPKSVMMKLPFDFRTEFAESLHKPLSGVGPVHYVSYPTFFMSRRKADDARRIIHRLGSLTTWKGSRREQLRRWSEPAWDEILQAQEEMAELANELNPSAAGPFSSAVREDFPR